MMRMTFIKNLACLALLANLGACAVSSGVPAGSLRSKLNSNDASYVKTGDRSPLVVLQSGFGDGKKVWAELADELGSEVSLFAYDRPGHAGIPAPTAPRDPCTIAGELRDQLRASGAHPPYLLVGHSLGGLYQYVFARLYSNEVSGLILLDPTHPQHWESMQHELPSLAAVVKAMKVVAFSSIERREFEDQAICLERLDSTHPLTMPNRLLVSGRFKPMEKGGFETMVKRLRKDWLRLSGAPKVETIYDSGHYLQKDSPEEVAAAIRAMLGKPSGHNQ